MSEIIHDAVLICAKDWRASGGFDERKALDAFRAQLSEEYRHLLVGPIRPPVNAMWFYALMPDGSKSGRDDDEAMDGWRAKLLTLVKSFAYPDFVHLSWGREEDGVKVHDFGKPHPGKDVHEVMQDLYDACRLTGMDTIAALAEVRNAGDAWALQAEDRYRQANQED